MRKIFIILFVMLFGFTNFSATATTLSGSAVFNWDKITQTERDNDIANIKNILFGENTAYTYDKQSFADEYKNFMNDKNYNENIIVAKFSISEYPDRIIVPFYYKKLLYGYGIIYKKDLKHCYYYNAMGSLFMIEKFNKNYNNYPVSSYQYEKNGKLNNAVYSLSLNDEYVYNPKGKFLGRWYKENYYNNKGKVIMTRVLPANLSVK